MANLAGYASTPNNGAVLFNTANTARDGTGTMAILFPASSAPARIDDLSVVATGTTTAGMLRFFVHNGTSAFLILEVPVSAIAPSGTVQAFATYQKNLAIVLKAGYSLRVTTHNAEQFSAVVTRVGDF
jgi:hypothetical protein